MRFFSGIFLFFLASTLMASKIPVDSGLADGLCDIAGGNSSSEAETYHWFVARSMDYPVYVSGSANFKTKAKFQGEKDEREATAMAAYRSELPAASDRPVSVSFQGGIANLKHTASDFKMYLGYKVDGVDKWMEMRLIKSLAKDYTQYVLDVPPGTFQPGMTKVWFEGRYIENGLEKRVYENNNGTDFAVNVTRSAKKQVCFTKGWDEALRGGALRADETVGVIYEHGRMTQMLTGTSYAGFPAWYIEGFYLIKDKSGATVASGQFPCIASAVNEKTGSGALERSKYAPSIYIPNSAAGGQLELWFQGTARGPHAWDSDYGKNYILDIEE